MRYTLNLVLITAILLFCSCHGNIANSEDQKPCQLLPEELLELAREKGYEQVTEFYINRPGMINPPYVYGYLPEDEENSAVFWCQKRKNGKKKYFLMFMFKNRNHELCNCPDIIEWENYPKGLSIYKDANTTLDGFVYMNNPKRTVPKHIRLTHNAIRSYYDGLETLFYCYKGEWLVRMRD